MYQDFIAMCINCDNQEINDLLDDYLLCERQKILEKIGHCRDCHEWHLVDINEDDYKLNKYG